MFLQQIYSDVLGALVTAFAAVFVLLDPSLDAGKFAATHPDKPADVLAGAAGFSLVYAQTFADYSLWIVRLASATEQNMTSVERLEECASCPT